MSKSSRSNHQQQQLVSSLCARLVIVVVLGLLAIAFLRCCSCSTGCLPNSGGSLRVGTYNIRRFGVEPTDMDRLTAIIEDARPDILGLQEVQKVASVADLARRLSRNGRRFGYVLTQCAGTSEMRVGFIYDETRVTLASTREYPELDPDGSDRCGRERSGLAAKFERVNTNANAAAASVSTSESAIANPTFQLLVLHMIAGGEHEKQVKRREQWQRAHRIAAEIAKAGPPVAILGDTNSTGFLDDRHGERTFILAEAKRAGLDVVTSDLKCTEYFQPKDQPLTPSVLDHFVASPGLAVPRSVKVHAFCKELACAPTSKIPADYTKVSDHCPVTLELR